MKREGYVGDMSPEARAEPIPILVEGDEPCTAGDLADAVSAAIDAVAEQTNAKANGVFRGGVLSSVISSLVEQFCAFGVPPERIASLVSEAMARGIAQAPTRQ